MHRAAIPVLMIAAALAGCSSSGNGVSTASILGSAPTPPAADAAVVAPVVPSSTPTSRAFQVGSVSARAQKCGYVFDEARLKSSYLANEMSRGTTPDQIAQIEKFYQVARNGVAKAAADEPAYCSEQKTKVIKADLNRLLAGDFEPPPAPVAKKEEDDGGFFGGLFSGGSQQEDNFGNGDWWEKQKEKAGG
jgi:hypothetical protein